MVANLAYNMGYFLVIVGLILFIMKFVKIILPVKRPSGPGYKNFDSDPPEYNPQEQLNGQMVGLANEVVGRNL